MALPVYAGSMGVYSRFSGYLLAPVGWFLKFFFKFQQESPSTLRGFFVV